MIKNEKEIDVLTNANGMLNAKSKMPDRTIMFSRFVDIPLSAVSEIIFFDKAYTYIKVKLRFISK
jgi:hypothetical protein